jgi:PhoPQ-activated pathogenicity-related protein
MHRIPDIHDSELIAVSDLSSSLKMVTAILHQVPNEPITFWSDPNREQRTETGITAFTWTHFIDHPDQPEWLIRLPMTKAAVATMNMTAELAVQKNSKSNISKFFIGGASKRGWTTWTTAAVDSRVIAITPIVMDLLNVVKNMHHQFQALGNWSFAIDQFYKMNFTENLDNPYTEVMFDIVDPFSYRDRLTMPKYAIDASGDEYFMPDDSHYWLKDMKGEMYFRMVPNAEHSLALHQFSLFVGIKSFVLSILEELPRPKMTWTLSSTADGGKIMLYSPTQPLFIRMWHATTIDGNKRRDFRLLNDPSHNPQTPVPHPVIWFESSVTNQVITYSYLS